MTDTPRRKRKAKTPAQAPIVLPKDVPRLRPLANIIIDADEVHLLISSLNAAIVVATADDGADDDVQAAVDAAMMFLDHSPFELVEGLVRKLHLAHTAVCETAPNEFRES